MYGDLSWKTRGLLMVPALGYLLYTTTEYGRAIGLVSPEPAIISTIVAAPRDEVFDAFVRSAELPFSRCDPGCRTESIEHEADLSFKLILKLERPHAVSRRVIMIDGSGDFEQRFALEAQNSGTRITSRAVIRGQDPRVKVKVEADYHNWGHNEHQKVVDSLAI